MLLLAISGCAANQGVNNMKDVFPIGIWYDGRVEGINCPAGYVDVPAGLDNAREYYKKTFTDIKNHNIETIVIPNTPPEYRETLLTVADEVGVKIVLEIVEAACVDFGFDLCVRSDNMITDKQALFERMAEIVKPLKKHKSLFAYQIIDEPPAELFEKWNLHKQVLQELDPARPAFSALCFESDLPRTSALGTQMLVYDAYPLTKASIPGEYDFRNWIALMDKLNFHASNNDIPYWIVVQSFARPAGHRFPTEAELRLFTYLPIAHNCKGVFFFLYNSMTQSEKLQGVVDTELKSRPIWATVGRLSAELKKLGPILLDIQPTESFATAGDNIDVQCFKGSNDAGYIFVSNLDVTKPVTANVELYDVSIKHAVNVLDGNSLEIAESKISVEISPGDCKLLLIK